MTCCCNIHCQHHDCRGGAMQYANINDAQAAMTSDQYVGLNADGTYGLFDRAQNPQWVGACQYAYQVAGVPFPNGLYGVGMTGRACGEAQAVRAAAVVVPRSVGRARLLRREEVVGRCPCPAVLRVALDAVLRRAHPDQRLRVLRILDTARPVRHDVRRASRAADIVQVRRMLPLVVL